MRVAGEIVKYLRAAAVRTPRCCAVDEKPSERRVREKAEAIRRARKLARKKMQRETRADSSRVRVREAV